eukprot:760959-Hanusia_phi.AAC.3
MGRSNNYTGWRRRGRGLEGGRRGAGAGAGGGEGEQEQEQEQEEEEGAQSRGSAASSTFSS